MEKGMIFSTDAMIAFIIILAALLGFVMAIGNYEARVQSVSKNFYLEEKTIMAADSFVKNHSNTNAVLGIAEIDYDKKRVKNNVLSLFLAPQFSEYAEEGGFFVKKIIIGEEVLFESELKGKECMTVRRLVLYESEKKITEYTGCLNE